MSREAASRQHRDVLCANVTRLREQASSFLTDVVLVCGDREFPAHRVLLSVGSPYFMAMFHSRMRETGQERIELKGITPNAMAVVLDFLYCGGLPDLADVADPSTLAELLHASNFFQIGTMLDYFRQTMARTLSVDNFLRLWPLGELFDDGLDRKITKLLAVNFSRVSSHPNFVRMNLSQLSRVLGHADLRVEPSDPVFKGVLAWVNADRKERSEHVGRLLSLVQLSNVTAPCVNSALKEEPWLGTTGAVLQLLTLVTVDQPPNKPTPKLFSFVCDAAGVAAAPNTDVGLYDVVRRETVLPRRQMGFLFDQHLATACFGHEIIFVGAGANRTHQTNPVYRYSAVTNDLVCFAMLDVPMSGSAGLCVLNGMLYVVPGYKDCLKSNAVQRVSLANGQCEQLAGTFNTYVRPSAFGYRDHVYASGICCGRKRKMDANNGVVGQMEQYDTLTDQWSIVASLPSPSAYRCSALHDHFYVLCVQEHGSGGGVSLLIYDLETKVWTKARSELRTPCRVRGLWDATAAGYKTELLLWIGADVLYSYDVHSGQWELIGHCTSGTVLPSTSIHFAMLYE